MIRFSKSSLQVPIFYTKWTKVIERFSSYGFLQNMKPRLEVSRKLPTYPFPEVNILHQVSRKCSCWLRVLCFVICVHLKFLSFCVTRHLLDDQESCHVYESRVVSCGRYHSNAVVIPRFIFRTNHPVTIPTALRSVLLVNEIKLALIANS